MSLGQGFKFSSGLGAEEVIYDVLRIVPTELVFLSCHGSFVKQRLQTRDQVRIMGQRLFERGAAETESDSRRISYDQTFILRKSDLKAGAGKDTTER